MLKPPRPTREETRLAIMAKADELFRQYGFEKTTVADIAGELQMSTANIYKFFPSKHAIVESTAERNLGRLAQSVRKVTQGSGGALERLEEVVLTIHRFHMESIFRDRQRMMKLIMTAIDENWACITRYDNFLHQTFSGIIQEGIDSGEFAQVDASATAHYVIRCLTLIIKPNLHALHLRLEGEEWIREQVAFIGRALR